MSLTDFIPTPADNAAEAAALLRQLEASGRFGRRLAQWVERLSTG